MQWTNGKKATSDTGTPKPKRRTASQAWLDMITHPEQRPTELVKIWRQAYFETILREHSDATFDELEERVQDLAVKIRTQEQTLAADVSSLPDEAAFWKRYEVLQ